MQGENLIFFFTLFFGGFVVEQTAKQNWFPTRVAVTLQTLLSILVDYASSLACYLLITIDIHKDFLSHRMPDDDVQHKVRASLTALAKKNKKTLWPFGSASLCASGEEKQNRPFVAFSFLFLIGDLLISSQHHNPEGLRKRGI